jgi:hypothetical protein
MKKAITKEEALEALDRLQRRESTLIEESQKLGFTHNRALRAKLRELMGEDAYAKLFHRVEPEQQHFLVSMVSDKGIASVTCEQSKVDHVLTAMHALCELLEVDTALVQAEPAESAVAALSTLLRPPPLCFN